MPKIDIPIKKLIELRPADWARYVQPGCREEWVTKFKTNYTPKKESRLDSVLEITDPGGPYLLNFEPMGYRDNALPARMLRYRGQPGGRFLWQVQHPTNQRKSRVPGT